MRFVRLLILLAAAASAQAIPLPSEREQWSVLQAGELTIYSSASESETKRIATDLLRMREAVGKVTRLNVRTGKPTHVFIFRSNRSFAPYRDALFTGRSEGVGGGFLAARFANYIIVDASSPAGVDRVVYHELAHWFIRNTVVGLPLWLDEGLAEYYSTFGVVGDSVAIGRPIRDHIVALRRGMLMPLGVQLALNERSEEYAGQSRQKLFYAQSWALVHYFLSDPARRARLEQFVEAIRIGRSIAQATPLLGATDSELEHALRTYIKRPAMQSVRYDVGELAVPPLGILRPVPRDELLASLGAMLSWNPASQAAGEALLRESLRLDPENATAHAMLGHARSVQGDRDEAVAHYKRAVALGSRDAMTYMLYGSTLTETDKLRARELFLRAVELAPGDARALAGVGMTYVGSKESLDPGIAALEKSLAMAPSQEDAAVNLIQLYAESGRPADARRLLEKHLAHTTNEEYLRVATDSIEFADVRAAERLFDSGRQAEAIDAMRGILTRTRDQDLQEHLRGVIGSFDDHRLRESQHETLREIVTHANSGRTKAALALIDELLPKVIDEELREQLTKMRGSLAKRRR
jgi:tetratricopeptide (TPR) repeat protein